MKITQKMMPPGEDIPCREVMKQDKVRGGIYDEITLENIVSRLTLEKGDFSADDLREALGDREIEEVTALIQKMLSAGILYESSPGRYRSP